MTLAVERGHIEMVLLLLERAADTEAVNKASCALQLKTQTIHFVSFQDGHTALVTAVLNRYKELVSLLLERGAYTEAKDIVSGLRYQLTIQSNTINVSPIGWPHPSHYCCCQW